MTVRQEKIGTLLKKLIARFLSVHPIKDVLATVTSCIMSEDIGHARVLISVYPENKQQEVLRSLDLEKRSLNDFLKKNTRMKILPHITFTIDTGETKRQKIDALLQK